jgi:hypothetical protein
MAGFGLSNAIDGYLGVKRDQEKMAMLKEDRAFQSEQRGRQRQQWGDEDKRRELENQARAAGRAVFEQAQQQAGMGLAQADPFTVQDGPGTNPPAGPAMGAQGQQRQPFKPTAKLVADAYDAAAKVYLGAGDFEGFTKKFAESATARTQYRNTVMDDALKQYRIDRDLGKLAKTAYGAINDGVEVADVVRVKGVRQMVRDTPAAPGEVRPISGAMDQDASVPDTLSFKLSDGTVTPPMSEAEVLQQIQFARMNPEKVLEMEFKHSLEQAQIEAKRRAERDTIEARGDQDRRTEGVKGTNARGLADVNNTFKATESEKDRAAALRERQIAAGATLGSARIGAGASVEAARIRAKADGSGPGGVGKRLTTKERLTMVEDSFGDLTHGGFGSKRVGSANTAKIVEGMEAYLRQNPDATESEAMNAAARVMGIKPEPVTR